MEEIRRLHPKRKSLNETPKRVLRLIPHTELWENDYAQVLFDEPPLGESQPLDDIFHPPTTLKQAWASRPVREGYKAPRTVDVKVAYYNKIGELPVFPGLVPDPDPSSDLMINDSIGLTSNPFGIFELKRLYKRDRTPLLKKRRIEKHILFDFPPNSFDFVGLSKKPGRRIQMKTASENLCMFMHIGEKTRLSKLGARDADIGLLERNYAVSCEDPADIPLLPEHVLLKNSLLKPSYIPNVATKLSATLAKYQQPGDSAQGIEVQLAFQLMDRGSRIFFEDNLSADSLID
eukprot:Filipodium_phascolosomae@DN2132_c0_g1_i3.p1